MKILIDIGHPAHVHLFRNFAILMQEKGHSVLFTVRNKEFEIELLDHYKLSYTSLGKHYKSKIGKIFGLFRYTLLIYLKSISYKPDIYLSHGSFYAAIGAWLRRKPHISFEDTFNMEQVHLYRPFSKCILTGSYEHPALGKKEIHYSAYHEVAYLHRNYFKPDPQVLTQLGVSEGEKYFILRFVAWGASHDIGHSGVSTETKRQLVELLKPYGRVFISSESYLGEEFEPYRFNLPPDKMLDAMAFASLFIGEGATMASECVMLGTPVIYINPIETWYLREQSKSSVLFHLKESNGLCERTAEILKGLLANPVTASRGGSFMENCIDITAFLVWFVENWPKSYGILKENPDYQLRFINNASAEVPEK